MKPVVTTALLLLAAIFCNAQTNGILNAENATTKAGEENQYTYQPHAGVVVPGKISASIIYFNKGYFNKVVPLDKAGNLYHFYFKAPDSTATLLICIVDDKKTMFDNNNETTFIMPLYNKTGQRFSNAGVVAAQLIGGYAPYLFKIKPPKGYATHMYEQEFKKHPALKDDNYLAYLQILYPQNKDSAKPILLAYAKQQLAKKSTEQKWLNAYYLYRQMGMNDEVKQTEEKILTAYPKGTLAKNTFYNKLYQDKEPSAEKYLAAMHDYMTTFNDSTTATKDNFYGMLISYYGDKKDWANLDKYDALITDKTQVIGTYNNLAWSLSGEQLDNPGTDLDYAATLSRRSLQVVDEKMNDPKTTVDERQNWKSTHDTYADTYALILYKLGKVDSAFYYEDGIDKTNFYDGGREMYARYAEKVKGPEFARKYIEEQLLAGVNSTLLQKQLKDIYAQLNLPEDQYEKIKEQAVSLARQKSLDKIKETLGSLKAKDFTLKDLEGNTVTLASYHDKVVVLDFWATWCGPCRASFPAMQQAVTKYKDDKDVVFLFMDISENGDEATIRKNTAKFIDDNHYTFHVLLDIDNKVAPDYKVEFIPDKFIINRQGNISFMGNELSDIDGAIADAKG
ncbi:MAG TPA: TlpA disulfide reductase family protein [Chitinophagaceae bacterium]|nr:TlpA disulfide reductase family protein [Chitinophagaceae bacterium]